MAWIISQVFMLFGLGLVVLLIVAVTAPLESLGWWAGWSGKKVDPNELLEVKKEIPPPAPDQVKEYYVVYLSGIGVASADGLAPDEVDFLAELRRILPEAELIDDVFPYSVTNNPLTGERSLRRVWKWVRARQEKDPNSPVALVMINIRNFLQVFVSADPRYGPIYSLGVAEEIGRSLARHNYPLGVDKPVFLIGFSGGGQVSIGATPYLAPIIGGPVVVITVGGFLSDDPGVQQVKQLVHQFGEKDPLQAMASVMWFGRWPVSLRSPWNRMLNAGRIRMKSLGPMAHNGPGGYYDVNSKLPSGETFCAHTAASVKAEILQASAAR